jgi:hypothetical protein
VSFSARQSAPPFGSIVTDQPPVADTRHAQCRSRLRSTPADGVTKVRGELALPPGSHARLPRAGLPAITGLWAAVAPLVLYAVLGSSRQLFGWTRVQHGADDRSCRRHSQVR